MKREEPIVVVAGGAGFLGSHLCERLIADGARVICVDNLQTGDRKNLRRLEREPRFDLVEADIIHPLPARLVRHRPSQVFNLACAASPPLYQMDPEHTMLTNVLGAHHLLRFAEACRARFLLASTSEVYGDPEHHPQAESYWGNVNCTGPRACYDEGKRAAETLAFDYDRLGRAQVRVARIFNTYGPRLRAEDGRVISNLVSQALEGEPLTIFGDGSQTRSFCYVDDLIDGLVRLMALDGPQPGPLNLGNPNELTISDLVPIILELTGSRSSATYRPLPKDDPRRRRPNIDRAAELLKWRPKTALEDGLRLTIAWFRTEFEQSDRRSMRMQTQDAISA